MTVVIMVTTRWCNGTFVNWICFNGVPCKVEGLERWPPFPFYIITAEIQEAIEVILEIYRLYSVFLSFPENLPYWRQSVLYWCWVAMALLKELHDDFIGAIVEYFLTGCRSSTANCN